MKGQRISELLNQIDDDLLSDALPPAWRNGQETGRKGKAERERGRILPTLGRIWNSGWTAAVLSVVVSAVVLVSVIRAGQNAVPPADGNSLPTPGNRPSEEMKGPEPTYDDTTPVYEGDAPDIEETIACTSDPEEDVVPWWGAPVVLCVDGCEAHGLWDGYLVCESFQGDSEGYEADGGGAVAMLPEIGESLVDNRFVLSKDSRTVSFAAGYATMTINGIAVYDLSYEWVTTVSGDSLDVDLLRKGGGDGYFLIVQVEVNITTDTYWKHGFYEYPVYVEFYRTTTNPYEGEEGLFSAILIEGYPGTSVTFDADAVEKALHGYGMDLDPDSDDMEAFAKLYGLGASPYDVSAMIRLIRSVPVPGFKDNPPTYASYFVGDRGITFQFSEDGLTYQFELILDASEANRLLLRTLDRLPEPIVVADYLRVVAVTNAQSDDCWLLWLDFGGVLAKVSVWNEGTSLAGESIPAVLDRIGITRPAE